MGFRAAGRSSFYITTSVHRVLYFSSLHIMLVTVIFASCLALVPVFSQDVLMSKRRSCSDFCFAVYAPVCGSDGKTYSNRCKLDSADCKSNKKITVAKTGACGGGRSLLDRSRVMVSKRGGCNTICMFLYAPVCGSDGKTYSNRCRMNVAACTSNKKITVARTGQCGALRKDRLMVSKRANCDIMCAAVYSPVCGSDGKTYSNGCALRAAACRNNKKITIAKGGSCVGSDLSRFFKNRVAVSKRRSCATMCAAVYAPVCGSDGKTYSNRCRLSAAACTKNKKITVSSTGRCGGKSSLSVSAGLMISKRECATMCIALYAPVCGSDGRTYSNRCQLGVKACTSNKKITVASTGRCGGKSSLFDRSRLMISKRGCATMCIAVYAPVCGSDGRTYSNRCKLGVRACLSNKKITVASPGRCGGKNITGIRRVLS